MTAAAESPETLSLPATVFICPETEMKQEITIISEAKYFSNFRRI
jgi:hypothetical protein